jgi:hypothetical protein
LFFILLLFFILFLISFDIKIDKNLKNIFFSIICKMCNAICCICLEQINYEKNISITQCKHSFHTSCLLQCKSEKCPICREQMYFIEETQSIANTDEINYFETPNVERNFIKKIIFKIFYIILQIFTAFVLIMFLNILTSLILMIPYKGYNLIVS